MNSSKIDDMNIDPSKVPAVIRPLFRIGASMLSYACPEMAIFFAMVGGVYSEISEQSTQKMLTSLEKKLEELKSKNLVTQDYLVSEHYVHLMTDILRKVYAFNTDQKRESVARIYMDAVQNKVKYADSDEKLFIEAIEKINTQEILILTFMSINLDRLLLIGSWENLHNLFSSQYPNAPIEKYKFKYFASRLEQMGFVYCSDLSGYDENWRGLALEGSQPSSAGVTPLGKDFLRYLAKE